MNWQSKLRVRSRDPAYLWRMVIAIIGAGVIVGWLVGGDAVIVPPFQPSRHADWRRLETLAEAGQWWQVWWEVPRSIFSDLSYPGLVALTVFAGSGWLLFLCQVLRVGLADSRILICLLGVALGVLSIWPTGFLIIFQEVAWNIWESADLIPGLRFFIFGVGLREELAKLICLLPLMPLLLKKRHELLALISSACVGLGFAVEENIGYFMGSLATDTMGRFLTANPLHMALTGLVGLNIYRAFLDPKKWGPQALAIFFLMVLAHGAYDAFSLPDLEEYSLFGMIIFASVMYQFFHELRTLRPAGRDMISLTATFLGVVSLLAAVTFVYISAVATSGLAADILVNDVAGTAIMVYLFLREMPETMVSV